jgi:ribosomal-protein-alanine N-acetyltransferase
MMLSDVAEVAAIERAAYAYPWTEGIFRDCLRVGYCCQVLCQEQRPVGYCILSFGAQEAHLLNLCVHPSAQGAGLGKYLLWRALDCARDAGILTMFLEVRPSNATAIALYRSVGFKEIGRRRGYYRAARGREDALVLSLRLS